jgi:hypothetical protein
MSDETKNLPKVKFLLYYVPSKWPSIARFRNKHLSTEKFARYYV